MQTPLILKSKITMPKLGKGILYRPSVQQRLMRLAEYPLTLLSASAGYGKTTSICQILPALNAPYGWYSPGPEDDSIFVFSYYMAAALENLVPGIRDWYFKNVANQDKFNWKRAFEVLLAGLEDLDKHADKGILVIDDWHLLHEPEIMEFFNRFLLCKPSKLHIVLLSREAFALPAINRLRAEGKVLEVDCRDLAFSSQEVSQLFNMLAPDQYTAGEINKIHEYTEGWIMAIKLIANSQERSSLLPQHDFQILFEYLAQDILNKQSEEMQQFLLISSIPEYLSISMCQDIFGTTGKLIDVIVQSGLFLNEVGAGQYRYHHMFRDFLYREAEKRLTNFCELHNKIAGFYLKKGEKEKALHYFLKGQDWLEAERIFISLARELVASGRGSVFNNYLSLFPEEHRNHPVLLLAKGDEARFLSDYHQALYYYQLAADIYRTEGNDQGLSMAYQGMGEVFLDKIEPAQAQIFLRQAYKKLGANQGREKSAILGMMAENMINQGKPRQAERYQKLARSKFYFEDDHNLEARIMVRTGRLNEVVRHLEKRTQVDKKLRKVHFSYRESPLLLSFCYSLYGAGDKALAAAQEGIRLGEQINSPFVTAVGYIRQGHAFLLSEKMPKEQAWEAYEKALEHVDHLNIVRVKSEVCAGQCLLYALKNAWADAQHCGLEGIRITEKVQDQWFLAILTHSLGMAAAICTKYEESRKYLHKAGKLFERCGDSFGKTLVNWWLGYVAYKLQNQEEFSFYFGKVIDLAQANNYEFLLERPSLFGDITGEYSALLVEEAKRLGLLSVTRAISTKEKLPEANDKVLRIRTLGRLSISKGQHKVSLKEWRRRSSIRLFSLFLTKRRVLLSKEAIMFYLWPEADSAFAARNFKSALNNLMNVLEPERKPWASGYYIQRKGSTYYFNLAANYWLDVDEFERSVETALRIIQTEPQQAEDLLYYALELYEGEYLTGACEDEWCLEERERLSVMYIRAAEALAKLLIQKGAYEEALKYTEFILEKDICWEAAYQLRMWCYGKLRNPVMVKRTYNRCQEVLWQELGINPSSKTRIIYNKSLV